MSSVCWRPVDAILVFPMRELVRYVLLLVLASAILILYFADVTIQWRDLSKPESWDHRRRPPPAITIQHLPAPEWLKTLTSRNITIPALRKEYADAFDHSNIWTLPTNATASYFKITNYKSQYSLCDTITVQIVARDISKRVKPSGGDYFFAGIYDFKSRASAPPDGGIVDHQNGTYTAKFTLRWVGTVKVTIFFVHPSEVVSSLRRVRDYFPARQIFVGKFVANNQTTKTACHVTLHMFSEYFENTTTIVEFCNYTDSKTGSPWFCIKPERYPCGAYQQHSQTEKGAIPILHLMHPRERNLFQRPVRLRSDGSNVFRVTSEEPKMKSTCLPNKLQKCIMGNTKEQSNAPVPSSGFYHEESWESFRCKISHFEIPEVKRCLQNRVVYFFGDSTIRQWFTYLAEKFDDTKFGNRYVYNANYRMGDDLWKDGEQNITMHYHHHGLPNMIKWVNTTDLHYMANMLDDLPAHSGTVIFLCIGAHFTISNLDFYRTRLSSIKLAIRRLQTRNKDIPIFVKTTNTRDMDLIDESNWLLDKVNVVLREEMIGMNVTIIDVWEMTTCHWTMFHVHPSDEIVKNEIDLALSYLCS